MNRILSKKTTIAVFVLPALLIFVAIAIVPLFISGFYSLQDYDGFIHMEFTGLDNYAKLFADGDFAIAMKNTLILIVGSVGIQLPLAFLLANALAKKAKGEKIFRTIYFIPVVISATVIGKLFYYIFSADVGLVNAAVRAFGVENFHFPWMTNPATAFLTVVVAAVWQYVGYHMLILYAGIKSIPKDYYEAALIDGASPAKVTMRITIPLLAPVIKTCVILAAVGSIKTYDIVVAMVGGGTHSGTQVPAILLWNNLFKGRQVGYGSAQAFFLVIVCLVISYLINLIFKKAEDNAT